MSKNDIGKPGWHRLIEERDSLNEQPHDVANELADVIKEFLNKDRGVFLYRILIDLTGNVTAALMLSQAFYWSQRTKPEDDGWFYKTREQWDTELGIGRREQEHARRILNRMPFWEEARRGVPARMYYRVNFRVLIDALRAMVHLNNEQENPVGRKAPN